MSSSSSETQDESKSSEELPLSEAPTPVSGSNFLCANKAQMLPGWPRHQTTLHTHTNRGIILPYPGLNT